MNPNNSAGRLYLLLDKCKSVSRNIDMIEAWRQVFDMPKDSDAIRVVKMLGKFFELIGDAQNDVKKHDLSEAYSEWQKPLNLAVTRISLQGSFGNFIDCIGSDISYPLKYCSEILSQRNPENTIKQDQLDEIYKTACDLYEKVLNADLPDNVRKYLLDKIHNLIEAINCYQITGSVGLAKALDYISGSIITNQAIAKESNQTDCGKAMWELLGKIATVLAIGDGVVKIGQFLQLTHTP